MLGSDGVFDCFSNNNQISELVSTVFTNCPSDNKDSSHILIGKAVDKVLKTCIKNMCSDNISAIIICFNLQQT